MALLWAGAWRCCGSCVLDRQQSALCPMGCQRCAPSRRNAVFARPGHAHTPGAGSSLGMHAVSIFCSLWNVSTSFAMAARWDLAPRRCSARGQPLAATRAGSLPGFAVNEPKARNRLFLAPQLGKSPRGLREGDCPASCKRRVRPAWAPGRVKGSHQVIDCDRVPVTVRVTDLEPRSLACCGLLALG
jgi:hypothetical protein